MAAGPKAPTLAFIHGGYWQMNDKETFAFFAEGLLSLGINLAVIEYMLAPAARLDRIVAEVRRAGRWLAEHLADYGADPSRLYVSGHSADGHLTAMSIPLPVRGANGLCGAVSSISIADAARFFSIWASSQVSTAAAARFASPP
jgi:arylformamidase